MVPGICQVVGGRQGVANPEEGILTGQETFVLPWNADSSIEKEACIWSKED
jgi:hypothetical protein